MRLEGLHPIQQAASYGFADNLDVLLLCQEVFKSSLGEDMTVSDEYCESIYNGQKGRSLFQRGHY
jgi:hypothetical protein